MPRKPQDQDEGEQAGADQDGSRERAHDETVAREEAERAAFQAEKEGAATGVPMEGREVALGEWGEVHGEPPIGDPDGSRLREHNARANRGGS